MSNNTQKEIVLKDCPYCNSFDTFKTLMTDGVTIETAYHSAVEELVEELMDDLADSIGETQYENGYNDGFVSSLRVAAQNMERTANALVNEMDSECTCGSCEREANEDCKEN